VSGSRDSPDCRHSAHSDRATTPGHPNITRIHLSLALWGYSRSDDTLLLALVRESEVIGPWIRSFLQQPSLSPTRKERNVQKWP
jgi:hypothetical protein